MSAQKAKTAKKPNRGSNGAPRNLLKEFEEPRRPPTSGRLVALGALSIALGHVEAVMTVYARKMTGLIPVPGEETAVAADLPGWLAAVAQTQQIAVAIVIISAALLAGRNFGQRLGAAMLAAGVWTITRYLSLRLMIDWPTSLNTKDAVLLVPVDQRCAVWLPLIIACGLLTLGSLLWRAGERRK